MNKYATCCRVAVLCILALNGLIASSNAAAPSTNSNWFQDPSGDLLRYLSPILKSSGKVGRIYSNAVCPQDDNDAITLPRIDVQAPSNDETAGVVAVRNMFQNSRNVSVTEQKNGIIHIEIGRISHRLLQTRIDALALSPLARYNSTLAIDAIEGAAAVKSRMDDLKIHPRSRVYNMLVAQPAEGLRHLPSTMTNVSMDEALDMVAREFGGIVLYAACEQSHLYEIDFAGGAYFDDSALGVR